MEGTARRGIIDAMGCFIPLDSTVQLRNTAALTLILVVGYAISICIQRALLWCSQATVHPTNVCEHSNALILLADCADVGWCLAEPNNSKFQLWLTLSLIYHIVKWAVTTY
jgi:hypothetical protein